MSHWWRAYDDAIDNPKLLKLSDALHRAWFTLQCIASANEGKLPPADDIATRLRIKPAKVAEWITRLVQAKLMDQVDGVFIPHNWKDRQFISDSSTPRVKRFRDRQRNVSGNVTQPLHETAPEAEAKADTESEQSRADAPAPSNDVSKREGALKLQIEALFKAAGQKVPELDRCGLWLSLGHQPGVITSTVEKILKRGKSIGTLDYFDPAIREAHPATPSAPAIQQVVTNDVWVDEGTPEWSCHQSEAFRLTKRGTPVIDQKDENGRLTGRRGWYFKSTWPAGFNDFGERVPPSAEDAA